MAPKLRLRHLKLLMVVLAVGFVIAREYGFIYPGKFFLPWTGRRELPKEEDIHFIGSKKRINVSSDFEVESSTAIKVVRNTGKNARKQKGKSRRFSRLRKSRWRRCWKYDPSNWTVTQLRRNCVVLKDFRKARSTVKRIVHFNGTVEFTVCNKNTRRCKEQPYFSWRLKKMVERPPCCIAHVLETFQHVIEVLEDAKIKYFLTAGGLVGWVKNRAIPRYENDLDILVDELHWNQFKTSLMELTAKYGHDVNISQQVPNFVRIYFSKVNKVFIDAWPYRIVKENGTKWVKTVSKLTWYPNPYSTIFPLQRTTFSGIRIWVPKRPDAVLNRHYRGRFNWKKTVTCKVKQHNKCIS